MKVTITESQYKKLSLIIENEQFLEKFKALCAQQQNEVTSIYSQVINLTVSEILNGSVDLSQLDDKLNDIDSLHYKQLNILHSMFPDAGEDFDIMIDGLCYPLNQKINGLMKLLDPLVKFQRIEEESKPSSHFPDVKPLDIQSF